jgi:hypothetical protein
VKQAHAGSSCQGVAHHAGSGIGGKRRPPTEIRVTPESEKWLKERAASPEGQKLLDELAMVFVEAAVRRLLKEQALRDAVQTREII